MTPQLRVRFDGKVFVPLGAVDVPVGDVFVLQPEAETKPNAVSGKTGLQALAEVAEQFEADPDWPADGAAQHDHYLYGAPKRDDASPAVGEKTGAQRLAEKLASYPPAGLPADFPAQHDHYLYGTPKFFPM